MFIFSTATDLELFFKYVFIYGPRETDGFEDLYINQGKIMKI